MRVSACEAANAHARARAARPLAHPMATQRGCAASAASAAAEESSHVLASCGCTPAVAHAPSPSRVASSSAALLFASEVPVMMTSRTCTRAAHEFSTASCALDGVADAPRRRARARGRPLRRRRRRRRLPGRGGRRRKERGASAVLRRDEPGQAQRARCVSRERGAHPGWRQCPRASAAEAARSTERACRCQDALLRSGRSTRAAAARRLHAPAAWCPWDTRTAPPP